MFRNCCCFIGLVLAVTALGCGKTVKEEQIEVKTTNDPLFLPRSVLQRYADGQQLGSEVTSFPKMIEDLRKVDAARAEVLEKGLQNLQQTPPASQAGKAKELLKKLAPSMQ